MPNNDSGMGAPYDHDEYYNEMYRDYGQDEPQPSDVVYDHRMDPNNLGKKKIQLEQELNVIDMYRKKHAVFVKRPAFVERPFFGFPILKVGQRTVTAGGAAVAIIDRFIEDRQRAIISKFGVDVDLATALANRELVFWFALDGVVMPVFDDQSVTFPYGAVIQEGMSTIIPGSIENPLHLLENGLQIIIRGRKRLTFNCQNFGATNVEVRAFVGYYQYWTSPGADEFEGADFQV